METDSELYDFGPRKKNRHKITLNVEIPLPGFRRNSEEQVYEDLVSITHKLKSEFDGNIATYVCWYCKEEKTTPYRAFLFPGVGESVKISCVDCTSMVLK
jgi:hypothetical protein